MDESSPNLNQPYTAIGHGREVNLSALGVPALLIFVGRETSSQARPIVNEVRERYNDITQLVVCNMADVRGIPKLVRKPVEMLMKSSYKDAVDNLAEGRTPEDYVLILPDWDGQAYRAFGVEDVSKQPAFGVLDRAGAVAGTYQGEDPVTHVLSMLKGVVSGEPA
jgi:hypothetical protein